jgi:hypothetical protein
VEGGTELVLSRGAQPLWRCSNSEMATQGSSQARNPWAGGRNPFGIGTAKFQTGNVGRSLGANLTVSVNVQDAQR